MMRWFWQKDKGGDKGNEESAGDRVRVFDFDTRQITNISAAELAPNMVRARMKGIEGEVWVDGARLRLNTHQHPPFSETVRDRLREIKAALDEVYPMSLEAWEDGFRRDQTPDREIAYWMHLAQTYSRLVSPDEGLGDTWERRKAMFRVLISCGMTSREQILAAAESGPLTRAEAEFVLTAFYGS